MSVSISLPTEVITCVVNAIESGKTIPTSFGKMLQFGMVEERQASKIDIWMSWCKRRAICRFCEQPIITGTPMVRGKLWKKLEGSTQHWVIRFYWHPDCWMKSALLYLEQNPYRKIPRKPKMRLEPEIRTGRLKLLREHARLIYKLKEVMIDYDLNPVIKLMTRIDTIKVEIEQFGGVPKKWG